MGRGRRPQARLWLRTSAGTHVQITATKTWTTHHQRVHNLTVANHHTYYVEADATPVRPIRRIIGFDGKFGSGFGTGATSILVHNADGCRTFGAHPPSGRLHIPETQGVYIIKMWNGQVYMGSATRSNTIHRRIHRAFNEEGHAVSSAGYGRQDVREIDWIEIPRDSSGEIHQHEQSLINYYGGIGGGTLIGRINAATY